MTINLNDNFYQRPNQDWSCPIHNAPVAEDVAADPHAIHCSILNLDQVQIELESTPTDQSAKVAFTEIQCKPEPSIRGRRKKFTLLCTALTIGFLITSFSIPQRNDIIAPGLLTSNHAQLLAEHGTDRCASCHDAGNGSPVSWLADTFSGGNHHSQPQSELCLKCHEQMMSGTQPMLAHAVSPDRIEQIRAKQDNSRRSIRTASFIKPRTDGDEIACAACHREHQGADHDLTAMTDKQCQTCHRQQFASFERGHPEFNSYPHKRRSRIAFDHSTHFGKHFPDKNKSFDCTQCHIGDSFQDVQQLKPYEQSCAQCHDPTIETQTSEGIRLISLPMLDLNALDSIGSGLKFGGWPENCTGEFDGEIPDLLNLLLQADPKTAPALSKLGNKFSFDPSDQSSAVRVWRYTWAMKKLLDELSTDGELAIERRLKTIYPDPDSWENIAAIARSIDLEKINGAAKRWFPELQRDVDDFDKKHFANAETSAKSQSHNRYGNPREVIEGLDKSGQRTDKTGQQKKELLAENPIPKLMIGSSAANNQTGNTAPKPKVKDAFDFGNTKNPGTIRNPYQDSKSNLKERELLAENPLAGLIDPQKPLNVKTQPVNPSDKAAPITADEKIDVQDLLHVIRQAKRKRRGIWIANDETYSIRYQPTGHADQFLKAFTELLACQTDNQFAKSMLQKMMTNPASGSCVSCHTIERNNDGKLFVNWNSQTRDPSVRAWTRFSHRPHLIQPQTADCTSCHQIDLQNPIADNFVGFDPYRGKSNFMPLTVNDCMSCHQKNQASNRCTTCHSYHIGSKVISRIK